MNLICIKCKNSYSIPLWIMKHITYQEYSYCDKCYKEKTGKNKALLAKLFTKK